MSAPVRRVRVLGVGSPLGDDAIGWMVAQALSPSPGLCRLRRTVEIESAMLDRPGAGLVHYLAGVDLVIIVDALVGDRPPGTIERLAPAALRADAGLLSAHGFGVASALELARALDGLPPALAVLGIHVAPPEAGRAIDPRVRAAVPAAVCTIAEIIETCDLGTEANP